MDKFLDRSHHLSAHTEVGPQPIRQPFEPAAPCADLTDTKDLAEVEAKVSGDDALALLVNNASFGVMSRLHTSSRG